MKISKIRFHVIRTLIDRLLVAFAVISLVGVTVSVVPAFGDDFRRDREERHDRGWHKGERHKGKYWRDHRRQPVVVEERYYQPAPVPVYAPPVVEVPPPPSVGINIVFPIHFR